MVSLSVASTVVMVQILATMCMIRTVKKQFECTLLSEIDWCKEQNSVGVTSVMRPIWSLYVT